MSVNNINFISSVEPSLAAGDYQLAAKQKLSGGGIDAAGTGTYFNSPALQAFHVDAPQFVLPNDLVGPQLPPPNAVGNYGWILPQIQLNRTTLPWERLANANPKCPWLALIVLRDDEVQWNAATNSPIFPSTVQQLPQSASSPLYFPSVVANCKAESPTTPVDTIRLTQAVFKAVVPLKDDVPMLCHCRALTPVAGDAQGDPARQLAMVTANRFPSAAGNGRNHCFLVSLEGYYNLLSANATFPGTASQPKLLQLVVLQYWTLVTAPSENVGFLTGLPSNVNTSGQLLLRVPTTTNGLNPTVDQRLQAGYIPAEYATGIGAVTYAWYRGPMVPALPPPLPIVASELPTSDAAMIYAEGEGVFDLSYAAAWQIGRALALADTRFAMDLTAFRTKAYRVLGLLMDRLRIDDSADIDDLQAIVDSYTIYNTFDTMISEAITAKLGNISLTGTPLQAAPPQPKTPTAPPTSAVDATRQFLAMPSVVDALATLTAEALIPVAAWLAQLQMLCKVPFSHLVPDERMLPQNSLRFFYLDQNWLDSLVAGAKSVGLESSLDTFFYAAMKGVIDDAVQQAFQTYVLNLAGESTNDIAPSSAKEVITGILIRSTIVSSFPNLRINAYKRSATSATGTPLKLLRKEKLSDSVMIALFMDVPDTVLVSEPGAGLIFGTQAGTIDLRYTAGTQIGLRKGQPFPSTGTFARYYRNASGGVGDTVLNIATGSNSLTAEMKTALGLSTMASSDLALQMLQSPSYFSYSTTPNPNANA